MVFELPSAKGLEFEFRRKVSDPDKELRAEIKNQFSIESRGRDLVTTNTNIYWNERFMGKLSVSIYDVRHSVVNYCGFIIHHQGQGRNGRVELIATENRILGVNYITKKEMRTRNNIKNHPLYRHDQYINVMLADYETDARERQEFGIYSGNKGIKKAKAIRSLRFEQPRA